MLLKRQEKDNVIKAIYKSSNVLASTYNKETSELILIFNKGSQYKYTNVKSSDYTRLELSESQGVVFNTHIKLYSFEKLGNIDPKAILDEVETLYEAEKKAILQAKSNNLVTRLQSLITSTGGGLLNIKQLGEIQIAITEYITEAIK